MAEVEGNRLLLPEAMSGPSSGPSSSSSNLSSAPMATMEALELAGRTVEKMLHADSQYPPLIDKLRIGGSASLSGLQEADYPSLSHANSSSSASASMVGNSAEVASLKQMSSVQRLPLPAELVEHFGHMQCNCMMGLFPQVSWPLLRHYLK